MTAIPYQTHVMIRQAVAPIVAPIHAAFRKHDLRRRLAHHAAKVSLDTDATIWYYKDTPVEIAFSRSMGFILLDHVRKLRSPGLNSLTDAMRARSHTLKEHENARADQAANQPAAPELDAAASDRDQAEE